MKTPRRSTNWASSGNGFGFRNTPERGGHGQVGHVPVLLKEAIDFLAVKRGGTYLDATVGLGGHSCEIAKRLGAPGHLIGFAVQPLPFWARRALGNTRQKVHCEISEGVYGVNWEAARIWSINPADFVEGLSVGKPKMQNRQDLSVVTAYPWVHPVTFSHEKHSIWNGCELCHPEIFPTAQKETIHFSMFSNIEGRYCGACHGKVAFPLNNCQGCHTNAPTWAP